MNRHPFTASIRTRITLWHLAVLMVTLAIYIFFIQSFLRYQLASELKINLIEEAEEVVTLFLKRGTDSHFVWRGHQESVQQSYWIAASHIDGILIYRNFTQTDFVLPPVPLAAAKEPRSFHTLALPDGNSLLMLQELRQIDGVDLVIRVGRTTNHISQELWHLLMIQGLFFPLILLFAWVGGYFIAGRVLLPLQKIIARIHCITANQLHERLPIDNANDELGHLSFTVNELLEKLERSFSQMRQFTGDASHELRTPLAAMLSVGETVLRAPVSAREYQDTIASMLEEVDKMNHLVGDLLTLARADGDTIHPVFEKLDLGQVVKEETARLEILADDKGQYLTVTIHQSCSVCLDRAIFRQAFANILHNAIHYAPTQTTIAVVVDASPKDCWVEIIDAGPGIAVEHQRRIFDRFYRVDPDRSRNTGGSGLGLSIAQWAIAIHGGKISLTSAVGRGSSFRIVLPISLADTPCPASFSSTMSKG